jgi:CRP-like cAMP-binding protein
VATRVARELLRFTPERDGTIVVALSHEELGSLCGASRWTVAEVLTGWRAHGIVDTGRRRIVVRDPAALARCAGT